MNTHNNSPASIMTKNDTTTAGTLPSSPEVPMHSKLKNRFGTLFPI